LHQREVGCRDWERCASNVINHDETPARLTRKKAG
jgi:hypothetical protein